MKNQAKGYNIPIYNIIENMIKKDTRVDEYLEDLSAENRDSLERIRILIFETIPDITETIAYHMPTYRLKRNICSYAAQKHHLSFYVLNPTILDRYRRNFKDLNLGRGCVRFQKTDDLPMSIMKEMILELGEFGNR